MFDAAGTLDETTNGSTLAINVRDHWAYPIAVLVFGSLIGWFSTKYLVAARKGRRRAQARRSEGSGRTL